MSRSLPGGVAGRRLAAAGALAVTSLGLSWGPGAAGYAQPSRVLVVAAAVLALLAVRRGTPGLLTAAAAVGTAGVLLGGLQPSPGRLVLAAAVVCVLLAGRTVPREGAGA